VAVRHVVGEPRLPNAEVPFGPTAVLNESQIQIRTNGSPSETRAEAGAPARVVPSPERFCGWCSRTGLTVSCMEITDRTGSGSYIAGIARKPLDSWPRPKPTYESDDELTRLLEAALRDVPRDLEGDRRAPFPLLDALMRLDASRCTNLARRLIFIAAANHRTADERRTAEYLLRHRNAVVDGRCSMSRLLLNARCAAEMDVRRIQLREIPLPRETLSFWVAERPAVRGDDPSVGEMVLGKLRAATGYEPTTEACREAILDAVTIALELAERHCTNSRSSGPSLVAMRADARKEARLATNLRAEFGDTTIAGRIARLLVGPEGTLIETGLLWWSARPDFSRAAVPQKVRSRWLREIRAVDKALACVNFRNLPGVSY
jgi:hypothetical protein